MKIKDLTCSNCKFKKLVPLGIIKGNFSTTDRDKQGDKLTLADLKYLLNSTKYKIFMNIEHDSSKAPSGKIIKTEIIKKPNGEYALYGEVEMYDKRGLDKKGFSISYTTKK